jgi:hypothetical protein
MNAILLITLLAAPDFEIEYESYVPPKYECFVFLGTDCPMAKLYANRLSELADRYPQIHFQGICANDSDSDEKVVEFQSRLRFGYRKNPEAVSRLGATRSPEAFLLVNDKVVYHGRIDDQYSPGTNRSAPTRCDLEEAIRETLAGKPVSVPGTKALGCCLPTRKLKDTTVTFEHVASIIHSKCSGCHRPGEVAPFSLLTYNDTIGWSDTIREVLRKNQMPPWHADGGHFANDRSLTGPEKSLLLRWVECGAPRGDREPEPPTFPTGWSVRPDMVLEMTEPFNVPAEGMLDYQEFILDPGFTKDTWIQAVEIAAGCRPVVHHINIFLRPKGAAKESLYYNAMQDMYFATMVPGVGPTNWPTGIAKVIPAGWTLVLSIHYQPNGSPQRDRSAVALQFADSSTVRQKTATHVMLKEDIVIPPNSMTTLTNTWTLEDDYTISAIMLHMHLRGHSMKIEADGKVLLNVPHFDFNWQHRYVFSEPKALKRGTVVTCTAVYDNTCYNPNNPNPNATVLTGQQSADEMMQASIEITRTFEDRLVSTNRANWARISLTGVLLGVLGLSVFARRPVPSQA